MRETVRTAHVASSVLTILTAFAAPAAAQQRKPPESFTVGTATARAGETAYGELRVPAGVDSGTAIAVAVIRGSRPGPTLAAISGAHGTEYASVVALSRVIARIDPKALAGTVIVAPLLNVPSFEQMTVHVNPTDRKGMNAEYPGKADGTQTERALAIVASQVVDRADVVLDLHGGDLDEDLRPYSYWIRGGRASQDSASRALALAFGLDHVIVRDVDLTAPAQARSLSGYAMAKGKTALVAEAGRAGTVAPEDVEALIAGTLNVLGTLGMLERAVRPVEHPVWLGSGSRVRAEKGGMFFPTVARGTYVSQGMRVGYTTDPVGRPMGDVRAPEAGVVTFIRGVPSMWPGATLVNIGPVLADPGSWARPTLQ
ncbi:MAG TPA: succinylglutamate desuccinylase/aspartoacylase family protein [Longimicrobiales bacterium]|nr:succinylglutamate desuccinylase/aspartoacylase family protein [Longimicrobiales bacterium]